MKTIDISEFSAEQAYCCTLCPRNCRTDRTEKAGFCGERATARIARAALHMWEEPCISGKNGSGTVFFSGCSLKCVFCQNYAVSRSEKGRSVTADELVGIYFDLVRQGAHNINLVTPTHFAPVVTESVIKAKDGGIGVPFVWNSSGYETPEFFRNSAGIFDVFLPDFKYVSSEISRKYSVAGDYSEVALNVLKAMREAQPDDIFENGLMKKGMIVRHLVLPGCTDDSLDVLDEIKKNLGKSQLISIMSQYTPFGKNLPDELYRTVTREEYEKVTSYALLIGLKHGYFQEGSAAKESFIPDFDS